MQSFRTMQPAFVPPELRPAAPEPVSYRLLLVGIQGVGKYSLHHQFIYTCFPSIRDPFFDSETTEMLWKVDSNSNENTFTFRIDPTRMNISRPGDAAASEHLYPDFRLPVDMFRFADNNGMVLVYSITSRSSFAALEQFVEARIRERRSGEVEPKVLCLVGNKLDCSRQGRKVLCIEGEELASKLGCSFVECSAKDSKGLEKVKNATLKAMGAQRQMSLKSGGAVQPPDRRNLVRSTSQAGSLLKRLSEVGMMGRSDTQKSSSSSEQDFSQPSPSLPSPNTSNPEQMTATRWVHAAGASTKSPAGQVSVLHQYRHRAPNYRSQSSPSRIDEEDEEESAAESRSSSQQSSNQSLGSGATITPPSSNVSSIGKLFQYRPHLERRISGRHAGEKVLSKGEPQRSQSSQTIQHSTQVRPNGISNRSPGVVRARTVPTPQILDLTVLDGNKTPTIRSPVSPTTIIRATSIRRSSDPTLLMTHEPDKMVEPIVDSAIQEKHTPERNPLRARSPVFERRPVAGWSPIQENGSKENSSVDQRRPVQKTSPTQGRPLVESQSLLPETPSTAGSFSIDELYPAQEEEHDSIEKQRLALETEKRRLEEQMKALEEQQRRLDEKRRLEEGNRLREEREKRIKERRELRERQQAEKRQLEERQRLEKEALEQRQREEASKYQDSDDEGGMPDGKEIMERVESKGKEPVPSPGCGEIPEITLSEPELQRTVSPPERGSRLEIQGYRRDVKSPEPSSRRIRQQKEIEQLWHEAKTAPPPPPRRPVLHKISTPGKLSPVEEPPHSPVKRPSNPSPPPSAGLSHTQRSRSISPPETISVMSEATAEVRSPEVHSSPTKSIYEALTRRNSQDITSLTPPTRPKDHRRSSSIGIFTTPGHVSSLGTLFTLKNMKNPSSSTRPPTRRADVSAIEERKPRLPFPGKYV